MEHRSSEAKLVELSRWAINSLIIPGFFPFRRELIVGTPSSFIITFKPLSLQVFYVVGVLITIVSWNILFYVRQDSVAKYLNAGGPTELYAYNISIGYASILGIYYGLFFLLCRTQVLKLWKDTAEIFDHLSRLSVPASLLLNPNAAQERFYFLQQPWFQQINPSMRDGFFYLFVPTLVILFVTYGYRLLSAAEDKDMTSEDIQTTVTIGCWSFFSMTGSGISCWLAFFIQFYAAAFKTVAESIKSLSIKETFKGFAQPDFYPQDFFNLKTNDKSILWSLSSSSLQGKGVNKKKTGEESQPAASADPLWIEEEIEKNLEVFREIETALDSFNELYGNIMVAEMGIVVINLLVYVFFALIWFGRAEWELLIEGCVPIYILAKELFDLGAVSEDLSQSAQLVVKTVVERVPIEILTHPMQLKLQMFVTQTASRSPEISAKQFFIINRNLVTSIISSLATFLVVLVQFKEADQDDAEEAAAAAAAAANSIMRNATMGT